MAVFTCEKCGSQVDTRCKPKKCPQCGESGVMCKALFVILRQRSDRRI